MTERVGEWMEIMKEPKWVRSEQGENGCDAWIKTKDGSGATLFVPEPHWGICLCTSHSKTESWDRTLCCRHRPFPLLMKNDLLLYKNIMDLSLDGSSQEVILRALQPRILHVPRLVALCEFHQVFDFGVLFYSLLDQVVRRPRRRGLCPLFDRENKMQFQFYWLSLSLNTVISVRWIWLWIHS